MKVKVITKFKDKYTKLWHEVNDEFTVTEERYEEIKRFVQKLETVEPKIVKNKKKIKGDSLK